MSVAEITGYRVGDIGRVIALQSEYYDRHWQLGKTYEAYIAQGLGELLLRFDPAVDLAMIARDGEQVVGSFFVDGSHGRGDYAWLRYFQIDDAYQGQGLGRRMWAEGLSFAEKLNRAAIELWTQDQLAPALHLYYSSGFTEVERVRDAYWGQPLNRVRLVKRRAQAA